jgi:hypothetical protein
MNGVADDAALDAGLFVRSIVNGEVPPQRRSLAISGG